MQFQVQTMLLQNALQPLLPALAQLFTYAMRPPSDPGAFALVQSAKPMALVSLDQLERTLIAARPVLSKVTKVIIDAEDPLAQIVSYWMQTVDSISLKLLIWRPMVLSTTCGAPLVGQIVTEVGTTAALVSAHTSSTLSAARRHAVDPRLG